MTLPTHKVQAITILDAAGMPHKDIAKAVGVEPKTVKKYVDIDYLAEQRRRRKAALLNRQLIDRELDEQKRAEIKRELSALLQRKEAAAPSITSEGHEKVSKLVPYVGGWSSAETRKVSVSLPRIRSLEVEQA